MRGDAAEAVRSEGNAIRRSDFSTLRDALRALCALLALALKLEAFCLRRSQKRAKIASYCVLSAGCALT
jgi:hypothetical protein